ncbi:MAG: class I SAM-dependent methyltransferase [Candidatus Palauibacterales bacterium]|nr:class I SAM-dependent methyltransferase [Candidatus Palauibacterales bacterium]
MSREARWDGLASLYDAGMAPLERWPVRAWRDRVRRQLQQALERRRTGGRSAGRAGRPPRVLEVGAGTGRNRLPEELEARVVAVDRSLDMLRRARRRGYRTAVVADVGALPFPDDAFAAGAETLVWCEVERPVEALAEVRRVLAAGARFVMLDHVRPPGLLGPVADVLSRVTGPWMDEWWNRDTRRYVEPAGFGLLRSRDDLGGAVRTLLLEKTPEDGAADDETEPTTEERR